MDLHTFSSIMQNIAAILTATGAVLGALAVLVAPFRKWIVSKFSARYEMNKLIKELAARMESIDDRMTVIQDENKMQNINGELMKEAILCSTRNTLTHIYYKAKEAGGISSHNRENFVKMYGAYSRLGGNSYVHDLYEQIIQMDIIPE